MPFSMRSPRSCTGTGSTWSKAWFQSRYDKAGPAGTGADYINCPLTKDQYIAFVEALVDADRAEPHTLADEDTPYFNGCLPVEIMAERGRETLRHGPMKPFGLTNPHSGSAKPYAVVQLRQDNALGTLYNMVGFQTKLKHHAQVKFSAPFRAWKMPTFARLGGVHRNTFLNSPKLLDGALRLRADPRLRFAGQITGCEGYVESAAIGLPPAAWRRRSERARLSAAADDRARRSHQPYHWRTHRDHRRRGPSFQPMNINFGFSRRLAEERARRPKAGAERTRTCRSRCLDRRHHA